MTKLKALNELLAKVEEGEVLQSHETSRIWPTYYDKKAGHNVLIWDHACRASQGSLDAAKALHDAVLPVWEWHIANSGFDVNLTYGIPEYGNFIDIDATAPHGTARAWLIAILKALIAQEESA